jgi:hypothetical protein
MWKSWHNKPDAAKPAIASRVYVACHCSGFAPLSYKHLYTILNDWETPPHRHIPYIPSLFLLRSNNPNGGGKQWTKSNAYGVGSGENSVRRNSTSVSENDSLDLWF